MSLKAGLTTWVVRVGRLSVMWRWNMHYDEAVRTHRVCRCQHHGYAAAGPMVIEW